VAPPHATCRLNEWPVWGQVQTNAPQPNGPWFDHRIGGSLDVARSFPTALAVGSPRSAGGITDAAAGVHCGARECGSVARGGAAAAGQDASVRFLSAESTDGYKKVTVPFLQALKETVSGPSRSPNMIKGR
jgi:hypothetical protein